MPRRSIGRHRRWNSNATGSAARKGRKSIFPIAGSAQSLRVFTTRPDTIFGATYMVLAPEHSLVDSLTTPEQRAAVNTYREQAARKSERERDIEPEKTGVFTGGLVVNPATGSTIPVWIADYVLMGYGTGAIMAVPGHDERDYAFARKFTLPIVEVVTGGQSCRRQRTPGTAWRSTLRMPRSP